MLIANIPMNGSGIDITGNGFDLNIKNGSLYSFNNIGINSSCYGFMPTDITQLSKYSNFTSSKQLLLYHSA